MKTDNEIEGSKKRIELLESQNARFKTLLDSALEITKKSKTNSDVDENQFWQETIQQIENEKIQMQEDLKLLALIEDERQKELSVAVRKLETENLELQKKVEFLLQQSKAQSNAIDKLGSEHAEFKFLLTQPQTDSQWLRNILKLDEAVMENASVLLLQERHKLQTKVIRLESKKNELLTAIEDISSPKNVKSSVSTNIRSDIEKALSKAISEVTRREFESLHLKVLELEHERAKLLGELQAVLDRSRKEIADEYHRLQQNILQIEKQKTGLKSTTLLKGPEPIFEDDNEEVDTILDAFANKQHIEFKTLRNIGFQDRANARRPLKLPLPTCTIL